MSESERSERERMGECVREEGGGGGRSSLTRNKRHKGTALPPKSSVATLPQTVTYNTPYSPIETDRSCTFTDDSTLYS